MLIFSLSDKSAVGFIPPVGIARRVYLWGEGAADDLAPFRQAGDMPQGDRLDEHVPRPGGFHRPGHAARFEGEALQDAARDLGLALRHALAVVGAVLPDAPDHLARLQELVI